MKAVLFFLAVLAISPMSLAKIDTFSKELLVVVNGKISVTQLIPGKISAYIKGEAMYFDLTLDQSRVERMVTNGFSAQPAQGIAIETCARAEINLVAEEGNFIPYADNRGSYLMPKIVGFVCHSKE